MPKIQSEKLSKKVADRLMEQILRQGLSEGAKLPTEPALMEEFGVSRTVVREAAALLASRGVVEVRPRRGMTVRAPDGSGVAESLHAHLQMSNVSPTQLLQVRLVLETAIVRLAAVQATAEDIEVLQRNLEQMQSAGNNRTRTIELDTAFHELLAAATHNPFFSLVTRPIIELLRNLYMDKDRYMSLIDDTFADHRAILSALEKRSANEAEKAMCLHLGRVEQNVRAMLTNGNSQAA
jgi:GntR family transcriptional repressor for pyruvate dehydrogenase complex